MTLRRPEGADVQVSAMAALLVEMCRPVIRELAKEIAEEMANGAVEIEIDQRSEAELRRLRLKPRGYLEAARDGRFASKKRGRRVVARFRDVEAWRNGEAHTNDVLEVSPRRAPMSPEDEERILLGLRPKRALRVVGRSPRA